MCIYFFNLIICVTDFVQHVYYPSLLPKQLTINYVVIIIIVTICDYYYSDN